MPLKSLPFFGEYSLRFNWTAFERMAVALGTPSFADFDKIMTRLGPVEIRTIVWAGLLHKYPKITSSEVAGIIDEYLDEHDIQELTEIVMNALTEASVFGNKKADKGETKPDRKPKPSEN